MAVATAGDSVVALAVREQIRRQLLVKPLPLRLLPKSQSRMWAQCWRRVRRRWCAGIRSS